MPCAHPSGAAAVFSTLGARDSFSSTSRDHQSRYRRGYEGADYLLSHSLRLICIKERGKTKSQGQTNDDALSTKEEKNGLPRGSITIYLLFSQRCGESSVCCCQHSAGGSEYVCWPFNAMSHWTLNGRFELSTIVSALMGPKQTDKSGISSLPVGTVP